MHSPGLPIPRSLWKTATTAKRPANWTTQIQSLEGVIDELGSRAALDPAQARASGQASCSGQPSCCRRHASQNQRRDFDGSSTSLISPDDTFGVLRLLQSLERASGAASARAWNVRESLQRPLRPSGPLAAGSPVPLAAVPTRSPARRRSIRARHPRRRRASRCLRRPTARLSRPRSRANTAT